MVMFPYEVYSTKILIVPALEIQAVVKPANRQQYYHYCSITLIEEVVVVVNLVVRNIDDKIVRALKEKAGRSGRSAEAEHRLRLTNAL